MTSDFDLLRTGRRRLLEFCTYHQLSVEHFKCGVSFLLHEGEEMADTKTLHHMTSTATCLESLSDCPDADVAERVGAFVENALAKEPEKWVSEGSAAIYCRCRTLPLVISHAKEFDTKIAAHLDRILGQLRGNERFAIGEADTVEKPETWYPPNAFHTFWTLDSITSAVTRFGAATDEFRKIHNWDVRRRAMILWAWEVLGCQLALHQAKSAALDTDQLIWALAVVTRFHDPAIASPLTARYRDLVKHAINTFFEQQNNDTGTWSHHEPLFHYREAGNAYCYIFESLLLVLKNALRADAVFLRALLRPHAGRLFKLLEYAEATKVPLETGRAFGWCSGHRTNMPKAESWATAAVFSCMQAMRHLVGIWTKEDALRDLNHSTPIEQPEEALKILVTRGDTWSTGPTVGEQLITMFVNPLCMETATSSRDSHVDPDDPPIGEQHARSAILFGPPGTSKTTLAKKVAAALRWEYVELHPSHFVAEGLPNVQKTADEIFTKLMELDRCVVLFDEIDELMRERESEPDAFGRFLTTSMLPKLAELWKRGRILYFVATNHVEHFDRALTRSERFDALVLVPPPAFHVKIDRLKKLILELAPGVAVEVKLSAADVEKALEGIERKPEKSKNDDDALKDELHEEHMLAKFLMLRWDQLDELAHNLVRNAFKDSVPSKLIVDVATTKAALQSLNDIRLKDYRPYIEFLRDRARSARDFGRQIVWRVATDVVPKSVEHLVHGNGVKWCVGAREDLEALCKGTKFDSAGLVTFPATASASK